MTAMIDELAKAICNAMPFDGGTSPPCDPACGACISMARAVVARLMEPTPGMFKAGQGVILRQGKRSCNAQVNAEDVFRAILSEAVREG